jgi:hypothetical protein
MLASQGWDGSARFDAPCSAVTSRLYYGEREKCSARLALDRGKTRPGELRLEPDRQSRTIDHPRLAYLFHIFAAGAEFRQSWLGRQTGNQVTAMHDAARP